jgi:hypothetical protein
MIIKGNISSIVANKLSSVDVATGEAHAALLTSYDSMNLASSMEICNLLLEGDSLCAILAITKEHLILDGSLLPLLKTFYLSWLPR